MLTAANPCFNLIYLSVLGSAQYQVPVLEHLMTVRTKAAAESYAIVQGVVTSIGRFPN